MKTVAFLLSMCLLSNSLFSQENDHEREVHSWVDKNGGHVVEVKEKPDKPDRGDKPGNPGAKDNPREIASANSKSSPTTTVNDVPKAPAKASEITMSWIKQMQNHIKANKGIKAAIHSNLLLSIMSDNPQEVIAAILLIMKNGDLEQIPPAFKDLDAILQTQLQNDATGAILELDREIHDLVEKGQNADQLKKEVQFFQKFAQSLYSSATVKPDISTTGLANVSGKATASILPDVHDAETNSQGIKFFAAAYINNGMYNEIKIWAELKYSNDSLFYDNEEALPQYRFIKDKSLECPSQVFHFSAASNDYIFIPFTNLELNKGYKTYFKGRITVYCNNHLIGQSDWENFTYVHHARFGAKSFSHFGAH